MCNQFWLIVLLIYHSRTYKFTLQKETTYISLCTYRIIHSNHGLQNYSDWWNKWLKIRPTKTQFSRELRVLQDHIIITTGTVLLNRGQNIYFSAWKHILVNIKPLIEHGLMMNWNVNTCSVVMATT